MHKDISLGHVPVWKDKDLLPGGAGGVPGEASGE